MIVVLSTFPPLTRNSWAEAALTVKQSMTNFKAIFSPKNSISWISVSRSNKRKRSLHAVNEVAVGPT